MGDPSGRATLARRAVAYAATWSAGATAARLARLYADLVADARREPSDPGATQGEPVEVTPSA